MTKIIASLVLASTLLASIGAAQAAPNSQGDFATKFFAELAQNNGG
jgi:hypothetical protein